MKKYFLYSLALVGLLTIANSITIAQTTNTNNQANQANQGVSAVDDVFDDYAQSKAPQISTINVIQAGDNPLLEIKGVGFGKNANQVKVIVNDNGVLITPSQVKNKKLLVQIPNGNLCSGNVNVRVVVGTTASNLSSFEYQKSAPIIYSLAPTHAQAGSVVEIAGDNLACNAADNLVTVNDVAVNVLSVNADKLTVRIPETFASGPVKIRLTVGTQASLAKDFTVDSKANTNDTPTGGTGNDKLIFISSAPSGASFAPMFAIREMVKDINAPKGEVPLWDMNFYGTHQAIIDLPFSIEGIPQKALLTINCREVSNVFGNFSGEK
ncbi:MAG: IPT/TIG domain-containing protein, partial [Blastocatellia bacterium]|nr:IPT/TIG domain-containing protein [Blastocatellia bacterium]